MKLVSHSAGLVIFFTVSLIVAADELPKLIVPAAVVFGMAVIGRLVWFHTRRW